MIGKLNPFSQGSRGGSGRGPGGGRGGASGAMRRIGGGGQTRNAHGQPPVPQSQHNNQGGWDYNATQRQGSGQFVPDAGGVNRRERWSGTGHTGDPQEQWLTRMQGTAQGLEQGGNPFFQQGSGRSLIDFIESTSAGHDTFDIELGMNKPLMTMALMDTDQFREATDYEKYTDYMSNYGTAASQMGQSATAGASMQENALARQGLGRSGASAAIRGAATAGAGMQQASLRNALHQQQMQARQMGAQRAYDAVQNVTAMALGHPMKSTQDLPHRPLKDWEMRTDMILNQAIRL